MSKLFFDHLVVLEEVDVEIRNLVETKEEKEELWKLVDEIVHHRVMGCILDSLPGHHHKDFLEKFHAAPHDDSLLDYLKEKIEGDVEEVIKKEAENIKREILQEIKGKNKKA